MDTLTGMAIFAEIVAARSFTGAARALGLSKSAVSKQVARLEDRLGARLLDRTTRRLSLTEAGAVFYERCARIVAEAEAAERAVGELVTAPRGLLKITAPMSFGQLHLGPAIADFNRRHPAVRIDLTLDDRMADLVGEGFDVAIRIARLPPSSLVARRLAVNRRIVCGAPAYFAEHGIPRQPQDLRRHNCLNYSYLASGADWQFRGPKGPVAVRVEGSLKANNGDVLRQAALAGIGLILTPTFLVSAELRAGQLVPVLAEFCASDTGIYVLHPHRRHVSPKVRAFVDFLAARCTPTPPWEEGLRLESPM